MLGSPVGPGRTEGNRCYRIKTERNMKMKIDSGGRGGVKRESKGCPSPGEE
jgi:hypothetical protein